MRSLIITTFVGLACAGSLKKSAPVKSVAPDAPAINYATTYTNDYQTLYADASVTAHVVASKDPLPIAQRYIVAFPEKDSGSFVQFMPTKKDSTTYSAYGVSLVNSSFASTTEDARCHGVRTIVNVSEATTIPVMIPGSIRTIRDFVESGYNRANLNPLAVLDLSIDGNAYNGTNALILNGTCLKVTRTFWDATYYVQTELCLDSTTDALWTLGDVNPDGQYPYPVALLTASAYPATLNITTGTNVPGMTNVNVNDLFDSDHSDLATAPEAVPMSFLIFDEKATAGAWRFLTYFGRDTLITLITMQDRLSSKVSEIILKAAIERVDVTNQAYTETFSDGREPIVYNSRGFLCHEETLGDYAEWQDNKPTTRRRLADNESAEEVKYCDYKMTDTDLLLLPALAKYYAKNGNATFLDAQSTLQPGSTLSQLLEVNADMVMDAVGPFTLDSDPTGFLHIRHETVGNWRDSNEGIGGGYYPFDVNVALVPACLRAIEQLSTAGILRSDLADKAASFATVWERDALRYFFKQLDNETADSTLSDWTDVIGHTDLLENSDASENPAFLYGISLNNDSTVVDFMHTDSAFVMYLLDNTLDQAYLVATAQTIYTQFPRGLMTGAGMVVCNAGFSTNGFNKEIAFEMDEKMYHGSVVWGFQQALMLLGLQKQINNHNNNDDTIKELKKAYDALWDVVEANDGFKYSEMWSWVYDNSTKKYTATDFGTLTGATESDVEQLWSNAFLGLERQSTSSAVGNVAAFGLIALTTTLAAVML